MVHESTYIAVYKVGISPYCWLFKYAARRSRATIGRTGNRHDLKSERSAALLNVSATHEYVVNRAYSLRCALTCCRTRATPNEVLYIYLQFADVHRARFGMSFHNSGSDQQLHWTKATASLCGVSRIISHRFDKTTRLRPDENRSSYRNAGSTLRLCLYCWWLCLHVI